MEIEEYISLIDRIIKYYKDELDIIISSTDIEDALYILLSDKEKCEWRGDLFQTKIKFEDAIQLLSGFKFGTLKNLIQTDQKIVSDNLIFNRKVKIKSGGLIWIIHRYDLDPFPSNPHAHNLESNLKLDLSNGRCFKIREHVDTIARKDLLDIRSKALKVYKGELPPLTI